MDRKTLPSTPRPGAGTPTPQERQGLAPDPNEAQWLDLGHSDQAFEVTRAVIEDSSLGLTLTEAVESPLEGRAPGPHRAQ